MAYNREQENICTRHRILHKIIVLSFVIGTTCICLQLVSLLWPATRDTGVEVDVLRQEVQFLRTELSNELHSVREQFERDLGDLLQRRDIGVSTGTTCGALNNLDETSKKIVKDALESYDSPKTGQIDFASGNLGAFVVTTYDTKDYVSKQFGTQDRSVQNIIKACVVPGECWAFKGRGAVVIQLIGKVYVVAVSMEHASRALLPPEEINSAPKDFSVWGLKSLDGEGHYLGRFSYDINGSPLQYFTIQEPSRNPFDLIELQIHTNHGNPDYTCLYRFRVHGSTEPHGQAQTSSETECDNTVLFTKATYLS